MPIKTSNNISAKMSDGAIVALQLLGYLDGKKKAIKGKNLSRFISDIITKYVGITYPATNKQIRERLLKLEILEKQEQRDILEKEMEQLSKELRGNDEIQS